MSYADRTKAELLALARRRGIAGRSRMTKARLVAALEGSEAAGDRRRRLATRLAGFVDAGAACTWTSLEGHPCRLPVAAGADRCMLHGGGDIVDRAVPITGRLGVDTWPTLLRHLWMASYDVDPFGLDPVVAEMAWHVLNGLYFDYFRVRVEGIEHVPMEGPALLAANHGGAALPYDGAMLQLAVANEAPVPRRVRVIGTEVFNMLPVVSHLYRKVGAAYATRADAGRLLEDGHLLGVFPEGERGFMKSAGEAYRVQRFGRGGFVETASAAKAPIVPVAIVGSEDVHPTLFTSTRLADLVKLVFPEQRVERIAVFANPIPLPVGWRIRFLPPVATEPSPDPLTVLEQAETVRSSVQGALDDMLAAGTRI